MISLIVPVYNAERYLHACVDSLLAQTLPDLQIILVDDGSTDGSPAIAQAYAKQDKRIEVYRQTHAGQSAARNLGLSHAQGDYIAFVDADDSIDPDWCQKHLDAISGVDYVQSGYTRLGRHLAPATNHQFTSPCMRLYRRQAIDGMRFIEGMIYEDVIWSVDLWRRGSSCRRIRYYGYHYTINPSGTTATRHPQAEQRVFAELKKRGLIGWYTFLRLKIHFILQ
jgi:glycosyltransferase involved in cell wall biosynthesis